MIKLDTHLIELGDIGEVAALMTKGIEPSDREVRGRQVIFIFETNKKVNKILQDYRNEKLMVNAVRFNRNLKMIKAIIGALTR